ncbi:helix-turn-helix domain-containing protein, partial [Methylobacterium gregans]
WLLLATDRIDGSEIVMTHEALAQVLGTHRPGITVALHELERAEMIATRRGQITVTDRPRLIRAAGESYGLAEAEYKRLIGPFA